MKADARCLDCHVEQALRVISKYVRSEEEKWTKLQKIMSILSDVPWGKRPIEVAEYIYTELANMVGKKDVYAEDKKRSNDIAEKILEKFQKIIRSSSDPLYDAAKLAIAGNLIDLGAPGWNEEKVYERILQILEKPYGINDYEEFKERLKESTTLFYLADNAGEIVLDRFFIEIMKEYNPELDVVVAAKSSPIINDVTVEDAKSVLGNVAEVIDSGLEIAGAIIEKANETFRRLFFESDLVIAKGQGNFEGLVGEEKDELYFLLTVKCDVVGDFLGVPPGTLVFMKNTKER